MDGVVDTFCHTEPSSARPKTSNNPPLRMFRTADTSRNGWSDSPNNSHIAPPPGGAYASDSAARSQFPASTVPQDREH
jgi:hypothetical protein